MHRSNKRWSCAILAAVVVAVAGAVAAQPYPAKSIRLVAPSTPGDAPDVIARLVAERLSVALGQQVVVENRPGAGGVVGSEIVAKSAPDGYTLIMGNAGSHGINAAVYSKLPYDILKDFAPVSQIAIAPNIFVVNPALPVHTIPEFIAYAKARPGQLSYASGGNGSSSHMSMELLKSMAGIDVVHVPYKGSTPALTDVISGQDAVMSVNMPPAVPHVKSGRLRALAVTTRARTPSMPELPTVGETLPGYETVAWFGVLAPAGTPQAAIDWINRESNKVFSAPDVSGRFTQQGAAMPLGKPDDFARFIVAESNRYGDVIRRAGIKLE